MKILRIQIHNLNSLKGTHTLDLTEEPLASAGLFAITGSTGAGKTTLLDAVTLALYGKAARYGNESNPEHVMTRHCGECSAEVSFEVPSGTYRAVWERHRAGKKADGKLQQPKRYIYDAAGEPLAQQIREAEQKIEELLGLNYDRFLRSVLLAQGDFARFLKANANERAELLESLTGTGIYSRLGKLAHSEANDRESELKAKEAGLEQITVLEDEARKELEASIKQGDKLRLKLIGEIESGAEMLAKITGLEAARKKEKEAANDQAEIAKERKAAETDLERLRLHRLTIPFAGDLAGLDAAEAALKSATANSEHAKTTHAAARSSLETANCILRASTEASLVARQREAKEAGESVAKENKVESEARAWLDQHKHDAGLADQVGDLAAVIGELKNARNSLTQDWKQWRQSASGILPEDAVGLPENLETAADLETGGAIDEFIQKAEKKQEALKEDGKEAKKQFELRKDHLEKSKLVAELKDHRHDLKSGEPCPLCGALEHPYANGAAPNAEITVLEEEVTRAGEKLEDLREIYGAFYRTLKALVSDRDKLREGIRKSETCRAELDGKLRPLSVKTPVQGEEDALRNDLQERERTYRSYLKDEADAGKRKAEAERIAKTASSEVEVLQDKISKLPPLPEGAGVEPVAAENIPPVADAEAAYADAVTHEKTTGTQLADRKNDEAKATEALGKLKQPLEAAVADAEFQTLDKLRGARLAAEAAGAIEELDNQLNHRATAAEALLKQARRDIAKLLEEKVIEGEEEETFKVTQARLNQEKDQLLEAQATRRNQIKSDDDSREQRKKKEKELEEEREALAVWRRLRELIGSHDGSKFRRYAQSISLDILTRHANRHLAKLSDRYLICRDEEEQLNLQIEDLHQAGTKRPMASLSGGESFLASLALALGLSDLAGRKVRIESLFIDEGFGSLDPETLEVAISALESLRQEHKTVGVISHVGLLKERISTQIVVERKAGGVSSLRIEC